MTPASAKISIHAIVKSGLDYTNVLLFGIAETQLNSLQRLQNYSGRVIAGNSRETDSKEVFKISIGVKSETPYPVSNTNINLNWAQQPCT